jgi:hypothetical protein
LNIKPGKTWPEESISGRNRNGDDVSGSVDKNKSIYGFEIDRKGTSDQIQKSQFAGLKVQRIARGWLARKHFLRLRLQSGGLTVQRIARGWLARKHYKRLRLQKVINSRSLSIVYVSHDGCNIDELATHMAKYQAVLTELQVRVKVVDPCESQFNLSLLRGGGSETQDGK